ncbi:hypothetical protein U4E84_02365 [Halorubrum sp. AD140]|uniref:hypothetical protein n=1 Tax=Halorubrum sp. AD140 TaxID=3050073 RepID=UPI002ACCB3E5|nr:hypothetical protein [Halorubrum sp. AD140]MDZ5810199.1 hypothetical protein [Halorubrum sp. AD140]
MDGDDVGEIESVEGSRANVRPTSSLSESVRQRLGWTGGNDDVYELENSEVGEFTDDAVMLKD